MNTTEPVLPEIQPVVPVFDFAKWEEEAKLRRAAIAQNVEAAKTTLFDILESHGIVSVTVAFDGYGDSGQIESVSAHDATGVVELPEIMLPAVKIEASELEPGGQDTAITDVIEARAFDLHREGHSGWENNDGAYGEFRFDTAARTITLGYNERFTSSEYSEHSW